MTQADDLFGAMVVCLLGETPQALPTLRGTVHRIVDTPDEFGIAPSDRHEPWQAVRRDATQSMEREGEPS